MARMHSRAKGKAGSKKPYGKKPTWIQHDKKEIELLIVKLAKAGNSTSRIGIILRDSYGIPDVKSIVGKKITELLEENKLTSQIPEDLVFLIRKEIKVMKHLENNKKDMPSKRGLQLTESKIKRLVKYYKRVGKLPQDWRYSKESAQLIIG
ncbi:MAG: 30S ribosomal protein S15 [Candidatus Woesearchaeota archaeon]|nr:MAG: 30S ribosomal protein S15 [Candidatus Woesearchaeota archaeon]